MQITLVWLSLCFLCLLPTSHLIFYGGFFFFLRDLIAEQRMFFLSIRTPYFLLALISKHLGFFVLNTKF